MTLAEQAHNLLDHQKQEWHLLRTNYAALAAVRTRTFDFDGFQIEAQFNPARITSTGAKVDQESIRQRKCFLCAANLPKEQRAIPFEGRFTILANPFPILNEHFTIPHVDHAPQRILEFVPDLLDLALALQDRYIVFYNGPRVRRERADHMHFQAGEKGTLPIESGFASLKARFGIPIANRHGVELTGISDGLRTTIAIESDDRDRMQSAFASFCDAFRGIAGANDEPLMNVLSWHDGSKWTLLIIPRAKHRPRFYFAEGDEQLLLSPASVDLGGICVLPRERDFERLDKEHLIQMCDEVCLKREPWNALLAKLAA